MVIRTLRDYDSGGGDDNRSSSSSSMPVPPQWQQQQQSQQGTFVDLQDGNQEQQNTSQNMVAQQEGMFWSWNLTGQPQWYHMLLLCCCPCFVGPPCSDTRKQDYKRMLKTFLFWTTIVQLIYFIVEISYGGIASTSVNPSIGPPTEALWKLGAKSAYDIKKRYQIWRLVLPIFMHAGFIHLFMNLYVQFMIGLGFERRWNWWRMGIIYIVAGIGGNLLSCIAKPGAVSVGASGALIGIIGARITDIIVRWSKMGQQLRISNVISLAMLLFFTMIMTFTSTYVDWASHLGGLIVGFMVGFAVFAHELEDKRFRMISMIIGIALPCLYYLATILVFALVTKV